MIDLKLNDNYYQVIFGKEDVIVVMLLVLGWLSLWWWVPNGSLTLWLSAGFALFAIVLAMPTVSRHWYWLPVGGLAGMGVVVGMMVTETAI